VKVCNVDMAPCFHGADLGRAAKMCQKTAAKREENEIISRIKTAKWLNDIIIDFLMLNTRVINSFFVYDCVADSKRFYDRSANSTLSLGAVKLAST
jgi:hypothetical protein